MILEETQENYQTGWIKLFRSVMKKGWYKKPNYAHLWNHLLLKCTHNGYETWFDGASIKLKPGQFVTGRHALSKETGIHESSIERILLYFEETEHQIEQRKTSVSRLISITNYAIYQNTEQHFEQRLNNGRTTTEQPLNTIQEHNNVKNIKKYVTDSIKKSFIPPTIEEFKDYFKTEGFNQSVAERAWKGYNEAKWHNTQGKPIRNWKTTCQNVWFKEENKAKILEINKDSKELKHSDFYGKV